MRECLFYLLFEFLCLLIISLLVMYNIIVQRLTRKCIVYYAILKGLRSYHIEYAGAQYKIPGTVRWHTLNSTCSIFGKHQIYIAEGSSD